MLCRSQRISTLEIRAGPSRLLQLRVGRNRGRVRGISYVRVRRGDNVGKAKEIVVKRAKSSVAAAVVLALLVGLCAIMLSSCAKSPVTPTEPKMVPATSIPPRPSSAEVADLKQCRDLVDSGKYAGALPLCEAAVKKYPKNAEVKYLEAYCLQGTNQRLNEAVQLYDQAQAAGFSEFWVSYNRGLLYLWGLKDKEKGRADLERAMALTDDQKMTETIKKVLAGIK